MKRGLLPILASLAGACLIGLLIYGISHQSASRSLDEAVARGEHPLAPEGTRLLPVLGGGGLRSLSSLRGKVVVLNFWASWCPPCQEEAPLLERFDSQLRRDDGTVLGVAYLDAAPDSEKFVHRFHLGYMNLRDNTGDFAHSYGTDQLPESFIINRQGRIVAISRGEVEEHFLERAVTLARST